MRGGACGVFGGWLRRACAAFSSRGFTTKDGLKADPAGAPASSTPTTDEQRYLPKTTATSGSGLQHETSASNSGPQNPIHYFLYIEL